MPFTRCRLPSEAGKDLVTKHLLSRTDFLFPLRVKFISLNGKPGPGRVSEEGSRGRGSAPGKCGLQPAWLSHRPDSPPCRWSGALERGSRGRPQRAHRLVQDSRRVHPGRARGETGRLAATSCSASARHLELCPHWYGDCWSSRLSGQPPGVLVPAGLPPSFQRPWLQVTVTPYAFPVPHILTSVPPPGCVPRSGPEAGLPLRLPASPGPQCAPRQHPGSQWVMGPNSRTHSPASPFGSYVPPRARICVLLLSLPRGGAPGQRCKVLAQGHTVDGGRSCAYLQGTDGETEAQSLPRLGLLPFRCFVFVSLRGLFPPTWPPTLLSPGLRAAQRRFPSPTRSAT